MKKELWVRVPYEMFNQIKEVAQAQKVSCSALIRQLVQEFLDKKKDICE